MSAKATPAATVETAEESTEDRLAAYFRSAFNAASRAVDEASPLERAARKGERDAYQKAASEIENYGDLEWAHEVCRDREAKYRIKSIGAEDTSAHMVRKYRAEFRTYAAAADLIEEIADVGGG
jgi:hypothetical protein